MSIARTSITPVNRFSAVVDSIQLDADGLHRARIVCPPEAVPAPGQYVQAHAPEDENVILPISLFPGDATDNGFQTAGGIPRQWTPGMRLALRGPLGHGFSVPEAAGRVALLGLDDHVSRLAGLWHDPAREVALFTDAELPKLPAGVEANPLRAFPEASVWADYIAVDLPRSRLDDLASVMGMEPDAPSPAFTEVLIHTAMPCGALGECGVCAVPMRAKPRWANACETGPVFPLADLLI